jgi:hypothetical protein
MPVPFFPLMGLLNNLTLLDPMTVFTPLSCGLVLLSSLCGLGIGIFIDRAYSTPVRGTVTHSTVPALPKAA